MVNFYNDVNESTNSNGELPLIPIAFQDSSELLVRTISTGNEIIESVHLTKWLQKRRTAFADQLDRYEKNGKPIQLTLDFKFNILSTIREKTFSMMNLKISILWSQAH